MLLTIGRLGGGREGGRDGVISRKSSCIITMPAGVLILPGLDLGTKPKQRPAFHLGFERIAQRYFHGALPRNRDGRHFYTFQDLLVNGVSSRPTVRYDNAKCNSQGSIASLINTSYMHTYTQNECCALSNTASSLPPAKMHGNTVVCTSYMASLRKKIIGTHVHRQNTNGADFIYFKRNWTCEADKSTAGGNTNNNL